MKSMCSERLEMECSCQCFTVYSLTFSYSYILEKLKCVFLCSLQQLVSSNRRLAADLLAFVSRHQVSDDSLLSYFERLNLRCVLTDTRCFNVPRDQ
jgi:hypothetical protein